MRLPVPVIVSLVAATPVPGPTPVLAMTYVVPDSVATISAALELAEPGDTVLVAPGTYLETITMVDAVALLAAVPGIRPIVDGDGAGPVVTAVACGPATLIRGFTFRNGVSALTGGGADIAGSSLTLDDCRFEDNSAVHGGGLSGDGSAFTLVGCEFERNTAGESGGAIAVTALPPPLITGCHAVDNEALVGGAIAVRNGCEPEITGTLIEANRASLGAALWYDFFTGGQVGRCTIVFHEAQTPTGGALYFNSLSAPLVTESIIAFGTGGGAVQAVAGSAATFGCNDVFGNAGGDALDGVVDLGTNISADPLFCDGPNGNYWLDSDSPCLPNGPCGLMGAFGEGDCELVGAGAGVRATSWARVKARYLE